METWTHKYAPKKIEDIQGQDKAITQLKEFIVNFQKQKKKAILLHGPPGVGKTSSIYAIINEMNFEIIEVNASDFRNKDHIDSILGNSIKQMSLFMKPKLILFDEVDGLSGTNDRGGIQALTKLIDDSRYPIILTGNEIWDQKFSSLRQKCIIVEFHSLNYLSIYNILKKICEREKIEFQEDILKTLARKAGGDIRGAINDLQTLSENSKKLTLESIENLSPREQKESIIEALMKILKTTDITVAKGAFQYVDEDIDHIFLWLDENVPKEYTNLEDLNKAYEKISKADIFKKRIIRWQHWRYLVYIDALLTAGIAFAKKEKYKGYNQYTPSNRPLKIWQANQRNSMKKQISQKIAEKTHSSAYRIKYTTIPHLKFMFKNKSKHKDNFIKYFELDPEEIEWLSS